MLTGWLITHSSSIQWGRRDWFGLGLGRVVVPVAQRERDRRFKRLIGGDRQHGGPRAVIAGIWALLGQATNKK
jgi:hypothetical protein